MAPRTRPSRNAGVPRADGRLIAIRARGENKELIEEVVLAAAAPVIVRMAMQWGYILRVRTRWAGDPDMRDHFGEKAVDDLDKLGIRREAIQPFASVDHIEVELYDSGLLTEDETPVLDAASEIPWEYLLSSATQTVGRFESLLVTRCLANDSDVVRTRPKSFLFVESAPGRIEQFYEFEYEEVRLHAAVNLEERHGLEFSRTKPFGKLREELRQTAWDAVHVTGVDTHQAAWLVEGFYAEDEGNGKETEKEKDEEKEKKKNKIIDESGRLQDGMILRGDQKSEYPVRYDTLADVLLASTKRPGVITLNLYYSGARTARELVKRGVYAALGFLDEIDDEFAELFFQAFYWAWCHKNKSIREAFLDAWSTMDGDRMHGTGIVIWAGRSMIADSGTSAKRPAPAKKTRRGGR